MYHLHGATTAGDTPVRVGRPFRTVPAAIRVAATMSRQRFAYVEVRDSDQSNTLIAFAYGGVVTTICNITDEELDHHGPAHPTG